MSLVPSTTQAIKTGISTGLKSAPGDWFIGPYTFDCWLQMEQENSATVTKYPVATGARKGDHFFLEPIRFSFQIGVTETIANNIFTGTASRPINAYNLLTQLQASQAFIDIGTKYNTYSNCLITNITTSDDFSTQKKLIATITIEQVIIANSKTYKVSANPHATDTTSKGNVSLHPIDGSEATYYFYLQKFLKDSGKLVE